MGDQHQGEEGETNPIWKMIQVVAFVALVWLLIIRACVYVNSFTPLPFDYQHTQTTHGVR